MRTALERRKFKWLHSLRCCLSLRPDGLQVSHLHEGSGTSHNQKVGPELTLPMHHILHAEQHRTRAFWPNAFSGDPRDWALRLHDLFEQVDDHGADLLLQDMHDRANLGYLGGILAREFAA